MATGGTGAATGVVQDDGGGGGGDQQLQPPVARVPTPLWGPYVSPGPLVLGKIILNHVFARIQQVDIHPQVGGEGRYRHWEDICSRANIRALIDVRC